MLVILDISFDDLYGLFESVNMQEVDVDYSTSIYVSFAEETGDILEQWWLSKAWDTPYLHDVVFRAEQLKYFEHVLVSEDKWTDFIGKDN